MWDNPATFGEVHGELRTYLSPSLPLRPTLALRAGGKRVWGDAPFFDAASLGASEVRGLPAQRFVGDRSAFGSAEVRLRLGQVRLLLPVGVGVLGFADAGRVWSGDQQSDEWHTGVGGGIWFSFIDRRQTLSVTMADGEDATALYVNAGFSF